MPGVKEYIDREAVMKILRGYSLENPSALGRHSGAVDVAMSAVEQISAADVAPVVHGRWIDNGIPESMLSRCSVCGFGCGAYTFKFCPMCGAKMDAPDIDVGHTAEHCVSCGDVIPEGRQVCPKCEGE